MDKGLLKSEFERIGSRIEINNSRRRTRRRDLFSLDVVHDKDGELFSLRSRVTTIQHWRVLDSRPDMKHLLLGIQVHSFGFIDSYKYLCGRDERHWFVAAIPPHPSSQTVAEAMEALKPPVVLDAQFAAGIRPFERLRRRNAAYIRQGEWFFVPRPDDHYSQRQVRKDEPLSRGNGSKPHVVEEAVRFGGEVVFVSDAVPTGLTGRELADWCRVHPHRRVEWREMRRGAKVLVRGRVWHPDHETITLNGWHEVAMNRESEAPAMRHVVFLD